jgi:uncharacterized protein YutE (UPF0331/DUF86 family)
MSPSQIEERVVTDRIGVIDRMLAELRRLPTEDLTAFQEDPRTPAAAESFLRRALEALLDLGRHLLAKGFGQPVDEYAAIADRLGEVGVLMPSEASLLREMARYRNRMVHFYNEITVSELYGIITEELGDFATIRSSITSWLAEHPEQVNRSAPADEPPESDPA